MEKNCYISDLMRLSDCNIVNCIPYKFTLHFLSEYEVFNVKIMTVTNLATLGMGNMKCTNMRIQISPVLLHLPISGFQAPLQKKLGLKLGLFSQKFRAFVNEQG